MSHKYRAWDVLRDGWIYYTVGQKNDHGMEVVYRRLCMENEPFYRWTGMKDCNGIEIYEDDILKSWSWRDDDGDHYRYTPVIFAQSGNKMGWHMGMLHNRFNGPEVEVVGNMKENPELIK